MKAVSLRITKFIFRSLYVQLLIHTSVQKALVKAKTAIKLLNNLAQLVEHLTSKPKNASSNPASAQCYVSLKLFLPRNKTF